MKKLKALLERRVELQNQMDALVTAADTEERAMTEEETTQFDAAEAEIRAIDATVAREERARNLESPAAPTGTVEEPPLRSRRSPTMYWDVRPSYGRANRT